MDCTEPDISVMDNKLFFSCVAEDMKQYQLDIELLQNIDTKQSRYAVRPRVVEFRLGIYFECRYAKQDRVK